MKIRSVAISLFILALCTGSAAAAHSPHNGAHSVRKPDGTSPWPQFGMTNAHNSYINDPAISTGTAAQLGVKWMANLFNTDLGSPVVAYNATLGRNVVYVGNQRADVFAIDATSGQIIWSTNVGVNDKIEDTPMVTPDGFVWVGTSYNATMYKLNGATGQVDCSIPARMPIDASPMTAMPGNTQTVYWGYIDGAGFNGPLVASNAADCSQIFSFSNYLHQGGLWATPAYAVDASGEPLAIVGTSDPDSVEYAVDAITGDLVWEFQTQTFAHQDDDIGDGATVSPPGTNGFADGVLYVDNKAGIEYALDLTNGTLIWQHQLGVQSRSSAALDGTALVMGDYNGITSLNAVAGTQNWHYKTSGEVLSSPAIIGPAGSEVVAFGGMDGWFRVIGLANGSSLYKYGTGSGAYFTSSPAEDDNGQIYIASANGFLYAFGVGGGNGSAPSTAISYPANESKLQNPNGNLTVTGSSSDGTGVQAVEIAVQSGGTSGPWYNAVTGTYNSAPIRNEAALVNPGAKSTTWSFSFPAPPAGGNFTVFANSVNTNNIVDRGTLSSFTIAHSNSEPNLKLSNAYVPPGSSTKGSGSGFAPGEKVQFTLFGNVVATATANSKGAVANVGIGVPATAAFGPTSLTASGMTSGKTTTATLTVTNNWNQFGHDSSRTSAEPHDDVINASLGINRSTVLSESWYYSLGSPVNTSPAVFDETSYFGDNAGVMTALINNTGAPAWAYSLTDHAAINTSAAVDSAGNVIFGAADGNLYELSASGSLNGTISLGGNLTSPAYNNGQIFVSSDNGNLYAISDSSFGVEWTQALEGPSRASPAYDAVKNLVIAGDNSGGITAFNATNGSQVWQVTTGGAVTGAPLISNGVVYVGSADSKFYAIDESTGAEKWAYKAQAGIGAGASLYANSKISFGDQNGTAYLVDKSGNLIYTTTTGQRNSPIVGDSSVEGNVMIERADGLVDMIRVVNLPTIAWQYKTNAELSTVPVIVDGTVYIGAGDGGLYAFTPQGANPQSKVHFTITDSNGWSCSTP